MFTNDAFFYAEPLELDALEPEIPGRTFRDPPETQGRGLWLAVLEDALRLYLRKPHRGHDDYEDHLDAVAWIDARHGGCDDRGRPTFAWLCERLGFDADWIRARVQALAQHGPVRIASANQRAKQGHAIAAPIVDLLDYKRQAQARVRARNRRLGLCLVCSAPAARGLRSCARHRSRTNALAG